MIEKINTKLTNCIVSNLYEQYLTDEMYNITELEIKKLRNLVSIQNTDIKNISESNRDTMSVLLNIIKKEWCE